MIKRIITFSAQNRGIVLAAVLVALVGASWSVRHIPLDALPDLSDTQVIVYSRWDRSPDIVEDQVTYPVASAMLGTPKVKAVRGFSDFGFSYVYVIFEDGTDLYWARSRVLEYLSKIQSRLPAGVQTEIGPDATGVGWVYEYALVDPHRSREELRSYQDWFLRYQLQSLQGENALNVIHAVKKKLDELRPELPAGMRIVTTYDRSELIERAIANLRAKLIEEMIIVSLVILLFLWHLPSAVVPIVTIPVSVLLAFLPMQAMGINANLMSLGGIAISIGVLVDGAIVEVENAYKKLQLWDAGGRHGDFHRVRLEALKEVGPSVFFSLLVIAVAFLPVFTLVDQEGRLFKPLAYRKP